MAEITQKQATDVCLLGHGADCCAFLAAGGGSLGWKCAKDIPSVRDAILARRAAGMMTAQGDNCSGPPDFRPSP